MKVQILRGKHEPIVLTSPKVRIQVYPYAAIVNVGDSHYPVLHGGSILISDDDGAEITIPVPEGPKSKYKQTKLDL
jgi:hypothetical protein